MVHKTLQLWSSAGNFLSKNTPVISYQGNNIIFCGLMVPFLVVESGCNSKDIEYAFLEEENVKKG